jgi:hypothetical protein
MRYEQVKRYVLAKGETVFATWPRPAFVPAGNWWEPSFRQTADGTTWRGQNILPAMWKSKQYAEKMAERYGGVVVEVTLENYTSPSYAYNGYAPISATANCTAESNFLADFVATHGRPNPYVAELRAQSEAATSEVQCNE